MGVVDGGKRYRLVVGRSSHGGRSTAVIAAVSYRKSYGEAVCVLNKKIVGCRCVTNVIWQNYNPEGISGDDAFTSDSSESVI